MSSVSQAVDVSNRFSKIWANRPPYIMFRIAKRVAELTPELEAKGRAPLKMSIGAPTVVPPQTLRNAMKEYLDQSDVHAYSVPRGEPYFRKAVVERMAKRFKLSLDADAHVCSLVGSKEGLGNMFRGLIDPKDAVADQDIIMIPDPGYASYVDAIEGAGGRPFSIPITPDHNYLPDLDKVWDSMASQGYDNSKVKALVVNYPSNPIGCLAPFSYYEHVIEFARKHNLLVISDNAYADLYYEGQEPPHSILEVPGAMDVAIEFHSLSKPYAVTGWRLGFAIGNEKAVSVLATVKSSLDSGIFKALQKAAVFAMTDNSCEEYVRDVCKTYEENQKLMIEGFQKLGWPKESLNAPKATFYLWLPIPPRYTSCEAFATDMLEQAGIVVVPGTAFGKNGEGFFRLSLVLPPHQLQEVVARMEQDGFRYDG